MQPGAHFAAMLAETGHQSVCTLSDLEPNGRPATGATIYVGGIGRTLDHEALAVHDVTRVVTASSTTSLGAATDPEAVTRSLDAAAPSTVLASSERFAVLYATDRGVTMVVEVTGDAVESLRVSRVPPDMTRVVAAEDRWYVANDAEVHVVRDREVRAAATTAANTMATTTARTAANTMATTATAATAAMAATAATDANTMATELIAFDAVDFALGRPAVRGTAVRGGPVLLCVADARGLTWFDEADRVVHRRAITSPTAIAGDALGGGWLVAADGDVLQLASPDAEPVVLARGVGLATRVRRDVDRLYASFASGELVAVAGIRHGATAQRPTVVAAFARGFTAFDAGFALYVDDGSGPRRFESR